MTDRSLLSAALVALLLVALVLGTDSTTKSEVIARLPGVPVTCMIYIYYPQYLPGVMEVTIKRDRVWAKGNLINGPENGKVRVKFTKWMAKRRLRAPFNQEIQDLPQGLCELTVTSIKIKPRGLVARSADAGKGFK